MWISVDSTAIAGGKSTLLKYFTDKYNIDTANIHIIEEPVQLFTNYGKYNPLELSYKCPAGNLPLCEIHFIRTLIKVYCEARQSDAKIYVSERSLFSPIIFTKLFHREGFLTDFSCDFLTKETLDVINHNNFPCLGSDKLFFINTPVDTCYSRLLQRGRSEELLHCFDLKKHLELLSFYNTSFVAEYKELKGEDSVFISNTCDLDQLSDQLYNFCIKPNT